MNPHSQRLLTAEARAANKMPKGQAKPKARPKNEDSKTKTKEKGKKRETKETGKKTEPPPKKHKSDREKEEASGVTRTAYSQAKKEFLTQEWFLGWTTVSCLMCFERMVTFLAVYVFRVTVSICTFHMCVTDPNKGWNPMFRRRRRKCIQAELQIHSAVANVICLNFFSRLVTLSPKPLH